MVCNQQASTLGIMGIKRCPSFSQRPGFPCGLKVLLLDADQTARSQAEELLKDCSYSVRTSALGTIQYIKSAVAFMICVNTVVCARERERVCVCVQCGWLVGDGN